MARPREPAMAEAKSKCHCCVPHCKTNKQKQPYLSFHGFPANKRERKKWVQAIFRPERPTFTILRGSTFVCSRHFDEKDFGPSASRRRLRIGSVPSRFHWNNYGIPFSAARFAYNVSFDVSATKRWREELRPRVSLDHDYAAEAAHTGTRLPTPLPVQKPENKVKEETEPIPLKLERLHFPRLCLSDEDVRFNTRFPSEKVFRAMWMAIRPSAPMEVYWLKAQERGQMSVPPSPNPARRLLLMDEFFLFCHCLATGLDEKALSDVFQVSVSAIYRVVITWANYLYTVLGSTPIWKSRELVKSVMPFKFRLYSPHVRVIVDCTEVRCESPSSNALQNKNSITMKGLIGIAPCGNVTFVSSLFAGSISNGELTERCGLLDLLEPGDGCMADGGFAIEKMLADRGAKLITPPVKKTATKLAKEDARKTQVIAQLLSLVERAIGRVKEYRIWDDSLPLALSGTANQLWTTCCLMTNFQGPLE